MVNSNFNTLLVEVKSDFLVEKRNRQILGDNWYSLCRLRREGLHQSYL